MTCIREEEDSANEIVYLIADVVPMFDEICRRAMNFISTCYQLGSELVSYVINCGLYFEHMNSLIGRNAVCCSLRYGISLNHICVVIQKNLRRFITVKARCA